MQVGVNHDCSISKAKKINIQPKKGGAHSVKFQTYKANLLASKFSPAYWDTTKKRVKINMSCSKNMIHLD